MDDTAPTLLCLCHLRWGGVWLRPQQLMTRFARHCRVIYVDPVRILPSDTDVDIQERPGSAGVRVLSPVFSEQLLDTAGNSYRELWLRLLPRVLAEAGSTALLYVSLPLADYIVASARPHVQLVVYDCMDDLASFQNGSAAMRARERSLIGLVDLLFTAGPSLYTARKDLHPHSYCFPAGVEIDHYRRPPCPTTGEPADLAHIPRPRLGYIGVLDERIDWALLAELADRRPDWHWVLVGPTTKVDPVTLPARANLHYLGPRAYAILPHYLQSFDIATMPFALNEATRFISPTKTLEYLAGGKQVISSSVPDVIALYRDLVTIADGPAAWLGAIGQALAAPEHERRAVLGRAADVLEQRTWDHIAARMWSLMEERLVKLHS